MKNYLLYGLIGLVLVLIILGMNYSAKNAGLSSSQTAGTSPRGNVQSTSFTGNTTSAIPVSATNASTGTVGQPDRMNAAQCRGTCRNVCGGPRPIARITKKQKDKGRCWDNCRQSYCRWVDSDSLNG